MNKLKHVVAAKKTTCDNFHAGFNMNYYKDFNITIGSDPEFVIVKIEKRKNPESFRTCKTIYSPAQMFYRFNSDYIEPSTHTEYDYKLLEKDEDWINDAIREYVETFNLRQAIEKLSCTSVSLAFRAIYNSNLRRLVKELPEIMEMAIITNRIKDQIKECDKLNRIERNKIMNTIGNEISFDYSNQNFNKKEFMISHSIILEVEDILADDYKKRSHFYDLIAEHFFVEVINKQARGYSEYDEIPQIIEDKDLLYFIMNNKKYKDKFYYLKYDVESYDVEDEEQYIDENMLLTSELGCDGGNVVGELRPKHGNSPIEHFNEIKKLMGQLYDLSQEEYCNLHCELGAFAGGYQLGEPLGGHIHFGFNTYHIFDFEKDLRYDNKIKKHLNFVDQVIADVIIYELSCLVGVPLLCITDYESIEKRHAYNGYGKFGAYRLKDYGLEWRMPSSWLVEPELCLCILSISYIVAFDAIEKCYKYYNDGLNYYLTSDEVYLECDLSFIDSDVENIIKNDLSKNYITSVESWIINRNWDKLHEYIDDIYKYVKEMTMYKNSVIYQDIVDEFFTRVKAKKIIDKNQNMLETWLPYIIKDNKE